MSYIIPFIIGAGLFRIGGSGKKWVRRYLLALYITLSTVLKTKKKRSLWTFPMMVFSFSLGYGEKHPYWHKALVGFAWVIPRFLFIGFSPLACAVPVIWISLFWLSNHKPWSNIFRWKWVELLIGGILGIAYN